jgi:aminobenzoyl-glutamate utilization protein B
MEAILGIKTEKKKNLIKKIVKTEEDVAVKLADEIWKLAEPPLMEKESSKLIAQYLESNGFKITWSFKVLPTAFKAEKGDGKPVIGMLGEYDALPNCGENPGTYGHGCGHNLLGVAPAVGVVTVSRILEKLNLKGKVVYWGCPAEETSAGKAYMARDGGFRGMDACLCWHPSASNSIRTAGGSAVDSLVFEFFGKASHAAGSPHKGRSALDAAILMDISVNYLREHIPEDVRIHSVISEGGNAPNVVPEYAKIWYYVRSKNREQVDDITRRVTLCAKGASISTETKMKVSKISAIYNRLKNQSMAQIVLDNFLLFGPPTVSRSDIERVKLLGKEGEFSKTISTNLQGTQGRASSDEQTVSWLAPLGGCSVACVCKGTTAHNREYTMQTKLPFAHKGMLKAAKVLAGTAIDLFTDKKLLNKVVAEFKTGTKDFKFDPLLHPKQLP